MNKVNKRPLSIHKSTPNGRINGATIKNRKIKGKLPVCITIPTPVVISTLDNHIAATNTISIQDNVIFQQGFKHIDAPPLFQSSHLTESIHDSHTSYTMPVKSTVKTKNTRILQLKVNKKFKFTKRFSNSSSLNVLSCNQPFQPSRQQQLSYHQSRPPKQTNQLNKLQFRQQTQQQTQQQQQQTQHKFNPSSTSLPLYAQPLLTQPSSNLPSLCNDITVSTTPTNNTILQYFQRLSDIVSSLTSATTDIITATATAPMTAFRATHPVRLRQDHESHSSNLSSPHSNQQSIHHSSAASRHKFQSQTTSSMVSSTATTTNPTSTTTSQPLGQLYKPGQVVDGFHVDTAEVYPSLSLAVYTFTHQRSKAEFVHIERDDTDNAFCIGFRTMPHDDTGVAHILEHTVLCGSKKFPVRDPFFLLIRKSFATFMNAMTRAEATYYPFSTQNEQDFNNLLEVYLDAVFFPLLRENDFKQEGHRIEPVGLFDDDGDDDDDDDESGTDSPNEEEKGDEQPDCEDDSNTVPHKFEFKGVVFNEMKGDLSDPRSWLVGRISRHLHPTSIYRNNSGGEPLAIPNLTHEQLLEFHATHYHPGNSIFMTYGNRPPVLSKANHVILEKLAELQEKFPEQCKDSQYGENDFPPQVTAETAKSMVTNSKRYTKPFCIVEPGPTASLEDPTRPYKASMTWLCRDSFITDISSPTLLNFDSFSISDIESTIDFSSIEDQGARFRSKSTSTSNDIDGSELLSPDEIINDDNIVAKIINTAQVPQMKSSKLSHCTTHQEWYNEQLTMEIANGKAHFELKVKEVMERTNLSREDSLRSIEVDSPDILSLVPSPQDATNYSATNPELFGLIEKFKKLSPSEQRAINHEFEGLSLSFLSSLIFDQTYSPLFTLLSDPSLGTSPSPTTGVDTWEHTPSFSMGFNGIKNGEIDMVLQKLFTALEDIAENGEGINASTMNAVLHLSELSLKDPKKQYGVKMLQRLISPFSHNQPIQAGYFVVDFLPLYKHILHTSGSIYFRSLIKYHILSNPHRLTYIMTPDHNLASKLTRDEEKLLQSKVNNWTDNDKLKCKADAIELKEHQDAPVDDSCLPSVQVSDIDPNLKKYRFTTFPLGGQVHIPVPYNNHHMGTDFVDHYSPLNLRKQKQACSNQQLFKNVNLLSGDDRMVVSSLTENVLQPRVDSNDIDLDDISDSLTISTTQSTVIPKPQFPILSRPVTMNIQPTNGLVIIRALINDVGSRFTPYQCSLIPFLNLLFGRIGAGGRDYKEHTHVIDQTATDFSIQLVSDDLRIEKENGEIQYQYNLQASIKGKCLARNVEKMCSLLVDSLTTGNYTEHVYNILAQYSGGLQSAIEENGPRFAMLDAQSRLPNYSHGIEQNLVFGLPHVQMTTNLFKQIAQDFQDLQIDQSSTNDITTNDNNNNSFSIVQKQSPRFMRLANDIAETYRCLILGHPSNHFAHARITNHPQQEQQQQEQSSNSFLSTSNVNYYGPTHFPLEPLETTTHIDPKLIPIDLHNINYDPHRHDPTYPNPHVTIPTQLPLTFPFGFDRILVTCDETTARHEDYKAGIISGVNHLINGVYMSQPTTYKPENSLLAYISPPSTDVDHDNGQQEQQLSQQSSPTLCQSIPIKSQNNTSQHVIPLHQSRNQYISSNGQVIDLNSILDQTANSVPQTLNDWSKSLSTSTTSRKFNYISAPVQVNNIVYCEKTIVDARHPDFGPMQVLAELVNERFLHTEVREKGGAYGRFASLDRHGIFSMGSIRDPQCTRTVDAFKKAIKWLQNVNIDSSADNINNTNDNNNGPASNNVTTRNYTQQDLDEAKIGIFGSIDAPESPANRGLSPWLRNANHADREFLRLSMLNTTLDDIQRCALTHLNFDNACISVVGNKEKVPVEVIDASNDPNGAWSFTLLDMEANPNNDDNDAENGSDDE